MKKEYLLKFALIFVFSLVYSAFNIFVLAFINDFILNLEEANHRVLLTFVVILTLFFGISYLLKLLVARINNGIIYDLKVEFVIRVLNTKMIFDDKKPKILASLSKDISNITNGFMRLNDTLQGLILVVLSFFYFAYLSFEISIFVILWFVFIGLVATFFINKARKNYFASRKFDDELYKKYEELLSGFKELRINEKRSENFLNSYFNSANLQKDANVKAEVFGGLSSVFLNIMMLAGIGVVMYLSLGFGMVDFKTATIICLSMMYLRAPFMMAISSIPAIIVALISLRKIKELDLIKYEEIDFSVDKTPLKWKSIELKNISFSYEKDKPVLKDINLTIKKGETIFLIGKNGSGKSTLFLILCGLLKPSSGEILVDGKVLDSSNLAKFQNSLSVVFADFYLFNEILNSDEKSINFWLETLKIKERVSYKKEGDLVKFNSLSLSTGQRKRVALLKNLLENKDFLMLDEFVADQDPEFREQFYSEILPLLNSLGISVFAISHDDRYFKAASKVYKIENGELREI